MRSLVGIWFVDGLPSGEDGILVVTPEWRVVQFSTSVSNPEKHPTHRLWMFADSEELIRFSAAPNDPGWVRRIEWGESDWTMIAIQDQTEARFRCRPAKEECLPDWFPEILEKSLAWMKERETKEKVG